MDKPLTTGNSTYVIGSSTGISESLRIVLYRREDIPELPKISLWNIDSVHEGVILSEKYIELGRENNSSPWLYDWSPEPLKKGFDVIIYISSSDNKPCGYTEFVNPQGNNIDLYIRVNIKDVILEVKELELENSLAGLKNNPGLEPRFFGDKGLNYTDSLKAREQVGKLMPDSKWSPSLKSGKSTLTNLGVIRGNKLIHLPLRFGGSVIDPLGLNPEKVQAAIYGTDILAYTWTGDDYCIYSLTKPGRFGQTQCLTPSQTGFLKIPDYYDFTGQDILYWAGPYAVIKPRLPDKSRVIWNWVTKDWVNLPKTRNYLLNELDPKSEIKSLPRVTGTGNVKTYIPELSSTYMDINKLGQTDTVMPERQLGDWYLFRLKRPGKRHDHLCWTGIGRCLWFREDEEVIPLTGSSIAIRTKETVAERELDYYSIYVSEGEWFSEKAKAGDLEPPFDRIGILAYPDSVPDYTSGKIQVAHRHQNIWETWFSGMRKSGIMLGFPEILSSIAGILFYREDNKIKYI